MKRFTKGDRVLLVNYYTSERGVVRFRVVPVVVRAWGPQRGLLSVGDVTAGYRLRTDETVDQAGPYWPKVVETMAEAEAIAATVGPELGRRALEGRRNCLRSIVETTTLEATRAKYGAELRELEAVEPQILVDVVDRSPRSPL